MRNLLLNGPLIFHVHILLEEKKKINYYHRYDRYHPSSPLMKKIIYKCKKEKSIKTRRKGLNS